MPNILRGIMLIVAGIPTMLLGEHLLTKAKIKFGVAHPWKYYFHGVIAFFLVLSGGVLLAGTGLVLVMDAIKSIIIG